MHLRNDILYFFNEKYWNNKILFQFIPDNSKEQPEGKKDVEEEKRPHTYYFPGGGANGITSIDQRGTHRKLNESRFFLSFTSFSVWEIVNLSFFLNIKSIFNRLNNDFFSFEFYNQGS